MCHSCPCTLNIDSIGHEIRAWSLRDLSIYQTTSIIHDHASFRIRTYWFSCYVNRDSSEKIDLGTDANSAWLLSRGIFRRFFITTCQFDSLLFLSHTCSWNILWRIRTQWLHSRFMRLLIVVFPRIIDEIFALMKKRKRVNITWLSCMKKRYVKSVTDIIYSSRDVDWP